jgi:lipopolysaccharide/colanic/teichoic acid biosynthesis glycosyltransferase
MSTLTEIVAETDNKIGYSDPIFDNDRINLNFLYIGTDKNNLECLSTKFRCGLNFSSLKATRNYIDQFYLYNEKIPDVIFIDVHLNKAELISFCEFLKQENLFLTISVIYNDHHLTYEDKTFLKEHQLVDDAISITSQKINFLTKIIFLKKIKRAKEIKSPVIEPELPQRLSLAFKRLLDIVIASFCLLALSPLFILIYLTLKLKSNGPVFYITKRAGKGFRIFNFYKFRSMVQNADENIASIAHLNQYKTGTTGPKFLKINNDPRITRFGKILRNTSLDELPQLFNVLKGDMSLVGNRPLPIYEADSLTTNEFVERFSAPAGITGLWQINKRGKKDMSGEERINLDISYARRYGIWLDLKIMLNTPAALFQKTNV